LKIQYQFAIEQCLISYGVTCYLLKQVVGHINRNWRSLKQPTSDGHFRTPAVRKRTTETRALFQVFKYQ